MNKVILIGRLTKDPDIRWTQTSPSTCIARFSLAVDRPFKRDGDPSADFISCVSFGKNAEFAEKYLKKGTKIAAEGRIQTGSYTNQSGQKVYTTDVIVERQEFAESKNARSENAEGAAGYGSADEDGFSNIPDDIRERLPFS